MGKIVQKVICLPIKLYQYLRPRRAPCCRFHPSCSDYAISAIETRGVGRGLWLACRRLLRCHPWSSGGYDPILPKEEKH